MSDSESNVSENDNQVVDDDLIVDDRDKIREKISTLSFEELLKMKELMGSKLYNKAMMVGSTERQKKIFKRANKNRPREVSSKVRPWKLQRDLNPVLNSNKNIPRDPRFDPLCGQFDTKKFKTNYKFITGIRIKEKQQLEKELNSCVDIDRQKTIRLLIQRMNNQIREDEQQALRENSSLEEKRKIRETLKKGEKPVFKKKSVRNLENLIEKYEELKKTNKLEKHIQRRSKKLSAKDRKKMKTNTF